MANLHLNKLIKIILKVNGKYSIPILKISPFFIPTKITEFSHLVDDFNERDVPSLGGSTDNEHCRPAWRR